jgi:hypothetical protein
LISDKFYVDTKYYKVRGSIIDLRPNSVRIIITGIGKKYWIPRSSIKIKTLEPGIDQNFAIKGWKRKHMKI